MAIAAAGVTCLATVSEQIWGIKIPTENIMALAGVFISFILGQAYVDATASSSVQLPKPPEK